MNLALESSVYAGSTVSEVAEAMAAAGYDAVLLNLNSHGLEPHDLTEALAGRIADTFAAHGIAVAGVVLDCDLAGGGEAAEELMQHVIGLCGAFGTDVVLAGNGAGDDWTAPLDGLREILDDAEARDVLVAIEPAPACAIADLDHAELLLDAVESDSLGLAIDPAAFSDEWDSGPADVLEGIGDALLVVFVGEDDEIGDPVAPGPGGATDFGALLDLLGEYAPDVMVAPRGVTPETAAATRAYLARML